MRMFLIGMCDIFLILYLTAITTSQPATVLTVDDFFTLKSMHETLQEDMTKSEEELEDELRRAREEQERLMAKLTEEQKRLKETEETLLLSDVQRERINQDLREKERVLKEREQLLANLNKEIAAKEEAQRKMEAVYQMELEHKKQAIEESQRQAEKLQREASQAQHLANQMQEEAKLAYKTAETAKTVQEKALVLKEQALKEKEVAEQRAAQALAAREEAEEEKTKALQAMEAAQITKKEAEKKAEQLAATIQDIKQSGDTAYENNIRPQLQKVNVIYERTTGNNTFVYERELTLMPVKVDGEIFVVFPSTQIGFTARFDKAPDKLVIKYQDKKITSGLINKDDDFIALSLSGFKGDVAAPYPADTQLNQLMPALLALRNNGNVSLGDKIRGISDDYFIVNRDYLQAQDHTIQFDMKGFRGTGMRAERIVRGDQLVDLNGRLIGVANEADRVIRLNTFSGWIKIDF